jgi:hypothetical protein
MMRTRPKSFPQLGGFVTVKVQCVSADVLLVCMDEM